MSERICKNSPPDDLRLAGARACAAALRAMDELAQDSACAANDSVGTAERRLRAAELLMAAAGPLSDFQRGFVAALADFAWSVQLEGIPDHERWTPESAMTEAERAIHRAFSSPVCRPFTSHAQ